MHIHILSLFWDSMRPYLDTSIMQRAQEKGLFAYKLHNITDWTVKNTRRIDDRPYGGGAGTILTIEPLTYAIRDIIREYGAMPIIYLSPRGDMLTQKTSKSLAQWEKCLIICGHYEGIDERIFSLFDIIHISIGEYVISSGELGALVLIDSMVRLIPGVISEDSLHEESYSEALDGKKEYPQYSRPQIFEWLKVPKELLSGDHEKIALWKKNNTQ